MKFDNILFDIKRDVREISGLVRFPKDKKIAVLNFIRWIEAGSWDVGPLITYSYQDAPSFIPLKDYLSVVSVMEIFKESPMMDDQMLSILADYYWTSCPKAERPVCAMLIDCLSKLYAEDSVRSNSVLKVLGKIYAVDYTDEMIEIAGRDAREVFDNAVL